MVSLLLPLKHHYSYNFAVVNAVLRETDLPNFPVFTFVLAMIDSPPHHANLYALLSS